MDVKGKEDILISLLHYPVRTLGPGMRYGIWFQGCSLRCDGCISPHTWDPDGGERMMVRDVLDNVSRYAGEMDGVTISGGEPFEQPEAFRSLLRGLRALRIEDILVYSGYDDQHLRNTWPDIIGSIDVLIDGAFERGNETPSYWKGSGNQDMVIMTEDKELRNRYIAYRDDDRTQRELQIVNTGDTLFIVGIPLQKDAEEILNGFG